MTSAPLQRSRKRSVYRPAVSKSLYESVLLHAERLCPLTDSEFFSVKLDPCVGSPVVVLLSSCSPAAILRRVSGFIVSTFQGHTRRAFSQVRKKVLEAFEPSAANENSTPTVIREAGVRWVHASFLHRGPRSVSHSLSARGCVPVTSCPCSIHAMTGLHIPGSDMGYRSLPFFSTKQALERSPSAAVTRRCVVKEHEIVHNSSRLDSLVYWYSRHGGRLYLMGCFSVLVHVRASVRLAGA